MNPFQLSYTDRLRSWRELRDTSKTLTLPDYLVKVDWWWQQAPLINNYTHPNDHENWADPWTMLSENNYCEFTRALGICYTLMMTSINDIDLIQVTDNMGNEHHLVKVDRANYLLNYHPDTVLSNRLADFRILRSISLDHAKQKIK